MIDRKFDRLERFDGRSRGYPVAAVAPSFPQTVVWPCQTWLDQGSEGACAGFAIAHSLACHPEPASVDAALARDIYHDAQRIDEFPGGSYAGADPHMEGTSVLAGFRIAKRRELRTGLSTGPAVLGVSWHAGMSSPDSSGMIRPVGSIVGGHAICCRGYDAQRRLFILRNSWGGRWGVDGDCFVSLDDMSSLLSRGGDACFPVKGPVKKTLVGKLVALVCDR